MRHPAATRYAKYVSWLSGITVSVGSALSLSIELYRTFHVLNHTDTAIMDRIDNVTKVVDKLREQGQEEFEEYLDQTIYDLFYEPLKRDSRGTYRLGIEDIPRSVDHPEKMDPLLQEITGLLEILENVTERVRTTAASCLIDLNRTSHLRRHTSADDIHNATGPTTPASHLEKGFTWHSQRGSKFVSPNDRFNNVGNGGYHYFVDLRLLHTLYPQML